MTRGLVGLSISGALAAGCASAVSNVVRQEQLVTTTERAALIQRAQLWLPTDVAAADLLDGPSDAPFKHDETITCEYVDAKFGGHTPKFGCTVDDSRHVLKVRYGRDNGEVYAGVAATRLLWALGFGADALYPVHVVCRHCPKALASEGAATADGIVFDIAAVEEKFPGADIAASGSIGWAWPELGTLNPAAGGASPAQRDAMKLVAVLLQHSDNKAEQQRLICRSATHASRELAACADPFLAIHDLGQTFGRANRLNRSAVGSVNLALWSATPIWKDRARCVANLAASETGTLADPVISEAGRRFLADLLAQLTDRQLQDLFSAARFADKPHGGGPVDAWVTAFKHKRDEIASARCPEQQR